MTNPTSKRELLVEVIKRMVCDNVNCGNGAICNFCSLRKEIEAIHDNIMLK